MRTCEDGCNGCEECIDDAGDDGMGKLTDEQLRPECEDLDLSHGPTRLLAAALYWRRTAVERKAPHALNDELRAHMAVLCDENDKLRAACDATEKREDQARDLLREALDTLTGPQAINCIGMDWYERTVDFLTPNVSLERADAGTPVAVRSK